MDPRVKSSLSEEELVFNPYTIEQLKQILIDRCKLAFYDNVIPIGVLICVLQLLVEKQVMLERP